MTSIQQLTIKQISRLAPSIMQTQAIDGVSDKYTFVSSYDAIMMIINAGWVPYIADEAGVRVDRKEGYQRHVVKFTREDMLLKSKDERIDLVMYNSHDRATAFMIALGIFRFICTNGLIVGENMMSFRHKHMGFEEGIFLESVNEIANSGALITNKIDSFKEIEMRPKDIERYAWEAASIIDKKPDDVYLYDITKTRRYADRSNDLWTVFNRTQENIIKGGIRRIGETKNGNRRKNTRKVQSIARDLKLNQQLWDLTEETAIELA